MKISIYYFFKIVRDQFPLFWSKIFDYYIYIGLRSLILVFWSLHLTLSHHVKYWGDSLGHLQIFILDLYVDLFWQLLVSFYAWLVFWYLFMHDWYSVKILKLIWSRFWSCMFSKKIEAKRLVGSFVSSCNFNVPWILTPWVQVKRSVALLKNNTIFIISTNNFAHVYHYLCRYVPSLNPTPIVLLEFFVVVCMYILDLGNVIPKLVFLRTFMNS